MPSATRSPRWRPTARRLLAGPTGRAAALQAPVELGWGEIGALLVMAGFAAAAVRWTRAILQQRLTGVLMFMGVITCAAMLSILLPQVALRGPLVVSAVLTVRLLAVSVVGMCRRSEEFADPLVDPRGGRSSVDRRPGITRAMLALLPWLLPIAAAVAALLEWATA